MKTRKLGRVLSLLLAFVLVAGIMVPASSVLAEESKYDDVPDSAWIIIKGSTTGTNSTHVQLKNALDKASTTGTTYIRLESNVELPSFVAYTRGDAGIDGNGSSPWVYCKSLNASITEVKEKGSAGGYTNLSSVEPKTMIDNCKGNDYIKNLSAYDSRALPEGAASTFLLTEDEKWGQFYEEYKLVVKSFTNVVIDLNGKKIDGVNNNASPYAGSPKFQMSVLTVHGTLTVTDLSEKGDGQITGGTGTPTGMGTYEKKTKEVYLYFDSNWKYLGTRADILASKPDGHNYRATIQLYSLWYHGATASYGGGVYVSAGGEFYLEGGKITGNTAWMKGDQAESVGANDKDSDTGIFREDKEAWAYGGGVYIANAGYFKMSGGEISANTVRAYNKGVTGGSFILDGNRNINSGANAAGGGVYLSSYATMDFTGGKIADNASFAQTSNQSTNSVLSYGGGIYIEKSATLNMMGAAEASGATTEAMLESFPQVTNNTSAGQTLSYKDKINDEYAADNWAFGAGIYNEGTLNIQKATVSANYFSELDDSNKTITEDTWTSLVFKNNDSCTSVYIVRDPETGKPVPGWDTTTYKNVVGQSKDIRSDESAAPYTTNKVTTGSKGHYAMDRVKGETNLLTIGAGVYNAYGAKMNIGERVWIYDNWDLVTSASLTPAGNNGTRVWSGNEWSYTPGDKDLRGYGWHDTRDDVYLSSGNSTDQCMYVADSLFECKIGVNYDNMPGKPNRVIVKASSNLGSVWQNAGYKPKVRDIQFFFVNDENTPSSTELKCISDLDYIVVHNDATSPTLSFAKRATNNSNKNSYITFDFTDSDTTYFVDKNNENTTDKWITSTKTPYEVFTGSNVNYDLDKLLIPDYSLYKGSDWADNIGVGGKTSIQTVTVGGTTKEAPDLYFKGWQYYASYGNYELYGDNGGVADGNKLIGTMIIPTGSRITGTSTSVRSVPYHFFNYRKFGDGTQYNDNFNYQYVPSFNTVWYSQDELLEARKNISNVMVQRVVLESKPDTNYLRFIAILGPNYANYDDAGFVISEGNNATPTVEGGYTYSVKSKIYKRIKTINSQYPNGAWVHIGTLLGLKSAASNEANFTWSFTDNSVFDKASIKLTDKDGNVTPNGNPNAGLLYTNLEIPAGKEDTTYYVTPYYRDETGYHYGESRAVTYNWVLSKDQGANLMSVE